MSHQCNYCNKIWSFKNDVHTLECEAAESILTGAEPLQYDFMSQAMPLTFFSFNLKIKWQHLQNLAAPISTQ